ncbi:MAG: MBL fold metallo-hydrolase [Candidatus Hydrogenedens sp.]|nr:MBL fold metallo-hydrolase [Candidatus Hydrogenedens sp.]
MEIRQYLVSPFMQNCLVLRDGGQTLVVDPGEVTPELRAAVADDNVVMVFNTHCHIDHAGGNAEMVRLTKAPLVCHRLDLPLLQGLSQQGAMFGVHCEPSPMPDRFVEEGDVIRIGGTELKVLFTPGHAPGHVSLLGPGFLIGGDCLFAGSIGRTDLPGGDYATLMDSIERKYMTLPDDTVVYSGHGPVTTIGEERRTNPFLAGRV